MEIVIENENTVLSRQALCIPVRRISLTIVGNAVHVKAATLCVMQTKIAQSAVVLKEHHLPLCEQTQLHVSGVNGVREILPLKHGNSQFSQAMVILQVCRIIQYTAFPKHFIPSAHCLSPHSCSPGWCYPGRSYQLH